MSEFVQPLRNMAKALRGEEPLAPLPWNIRIPAAIAKAERLTKCSVPSCDHTIDRKNSAGRVILFTATEVALAKALWDMTLIIVRGKEPGVEFIPPALIAFSEKVESLD